MLRAPVSSSSPALRHRRLTTSLIAEPCWKKRDTRRASPDPPSTTWRASRAQQKKCRWHTSATQSTLPRRAGLQGGRTWSAACELHLSTFLLQLCAAQQVPNCPLSPCSATQLPRPQIIWITRDAEDACMHGRQDLASSIGYFLLPSQPANMRRTDAQSVGRLLCCARRHQGRYMPLIAERSLQEANQLCSSKVHTCLVCWREWCGAAAQYGTAQQAKGGASGAQLPSASALPRSTELQEGARASGRLESLHPSCATALCLEDSPAELPIG